MKFLAEFPPGYEAAAWVLAPGNIVVLAHPALPVVYLDEARMEWRVLDCHVADVHPAHDPSTCK